MSLGSQVSQGLKWQAVNMGGRLLLSLGVFGTLSRLLDPADFGLMGLVYVYSSFVGLLADQGVQAAVIQRANLEPGHVDTSFWFGLGCAGVCCAGTILLAHPLSTLLGDARLAPMLRWTSLGLIASAGASTQQALFSREMEFRRPALCSMVSQLVGGVVGVGMALAGQGVWALVGQQLAVSVASMVLLSSMSAYRPGRRVSLRHLRELLTFGGPLLINWVLGFFASKLDQLVIGRFAGADALGNYVIAGKLPETITMVTLPPITDVTAPALSRLQFEHDRMRRAIARGMAISSTVMCAVLVGLAAVSSDLIPLAFGTKWAGASFLCALLSVRALLQSLQVLGYPTLLASGAPGRQLALNVCNAAGGLVACVVGIQFGVVYLVAGLIVNSLIQLLLLMLTLQRQIKLSPAEYLKPCVAPVGAAVMMLLLTKTGGLLFPAGSSALPKLACEVVIGAAAYLGLLYYMSRETLYELERALRQGLRRGV